MRAWSSVKTSRRFLLALAIFAAACSRPAPRETQITPAELPEMKWEELHRRSRGSEVAFAMWAGEEDRNRHFRGAVADELRKQFGITLRIVPYSDTAEVVNKLITEKSAGRRAGSVDLVWINGENFRSARQGGVLWGPFADSIPSARYYPGSARLRDFGTAIEGYETPWQRAQFVLAHDPLRTPRPPQSIEALRTWVKAHPGRFTYIAPPEFSGSAFVRHILLHFGDSRAAFENFDEAHYQRASVKAIDYLKEIRPYLWREGRTYPATIREQDRLFANQEVDFAMSYGPAFASVRIERGEFPPSTRTFVFNEGTIANYNYLAIPFNAPNTAGALIAANYMSSFEPLLELSRVLKSSFPLSLEKLSDAQRNQVEALPRGVATLSDSVLSSHSIPEPHADYLSRFEKDWQEKVLRQ